MVCTGNARVGFALGMYISCSLGTQWEPVFLWNVGLSNIVEYKPIFHWKQRSRWVPNAKNKQRNVNHIPMAHIGFARLGVGSPKLSIGFLDTNMLVSPMQNGRVGGLNQRYGPTGAVSRCSGI